MILKIDYVKIQMSPDEAKELREEIQAMINEIGMADTTLGGYFDEPALREKYSQLNTLLGILNVREELPF